MEVMWYNYFTHSRELYPMATDRKTETIKGFFETKYVSPHELLINNPPLPPPPLQCKLYPYHVV